MRIVPIIQAAAVVVALAVPASQAEAKGRRAFGGVWTAAHAPVPMRATISDTATSTPASAPSMAAPTPAPAPILGRTSVAEVKPVVREAVAGTPWCGKGRVFGSGAGFCEIN